MIRTAIPADTDALCALAEATGLFTPDELEAFGQMVSETVNGAADGEHCWIVDDDGGVQSAAYYAPEPWGAGVWNLYFIGVLPEQQGKGRGAALLDHVERGLSEAGARLLLVETSGLDTFVRTRAFYAKNGYDEEARIRDFYADGDDKIVFRKSLMSKR